MLNFCLVSLFVNGVVKFTCLQHRFPNFVRHGLEYSVFLDLLVVPTTVLLTLFLLPTKS